LSAICSGCESSRLSVLRERISQRLYQFLSNFFETFVETYFFAVMTTIYNEPYKNIAFRTSARCNIAKNQNEYTLFKSQVEECRLLGCDAVWLL
jgi:hypothetical protein